MKRFRMLILCIVLLFCSLVALSEGEKGTRRNPFPANIEDRGMPRRFPEYYRMNPDEAGDPDGFHELDRLRYPGVTQRDGSDYKYYGIVYRSVDGGQSWQAITPQSQEWEWGWIYDLEISANDDIYIASDRGFFKTDADVINWIHSEDTWGGYSLVSDPGNANNIRMGTYDELYESNDAGETWSSLGLNSMGMYPYGIYDLIWKSSSPTNILCSTQGKGVLIYNDGNWDINNGPYGGVVNKLAMHPDNPNTIFACTQDGGLYQSLDGASTWNYHSHGDLYQIYDLQFAPSNPDIIYLLGEGLLSYSSNGGLDWSNTNIGDYYRDWYDSYLVINPGDPGVILICGRFYDLSWNRWNGILKSSDYGQTWEEVYEIETGGTSYFRNFVVDTLNSDHIIAGGYYYDNDDVRHNILIESYDWGDSFSEISLPAAESTALLYLCFSPHESQTLVAGFSNGKLYKSPDNGINWELIYTGNSGRTIEWDIADPQILYMGTYSGIMKSIDGGYHWEEISLEEFNLTYVNSIIQNPVNPDIILAGSWYGCGVYESSDRGETWQPAVEGLHNTILYYNGLAQDPTNADVIYAASLYNGLFKSIDGGGSWQRLPESPGSEYFAIEVSEFNHSAVYAASYRQFLKSMDGGQTWQSYYFDTYVELLDIETHGSLSDKIYLAGRGYSSEHGSYLPAFCSSNDNGNTWEIDYISTDIEYGYIFDLEIDPDNPSVLYACGFVEKEINPYDISLTIGGTEQTPGDIVDIPVMVNYGFSNVAMIQLQISYCTDLLTYNGMSSDYGLSSGDVNNLGDQINIVWVYSGTPMEVPDGDTLIVLNFEVNASATEGQTCSLDFIGENNIGDPNENAFTLELQGGAFTVIEGYTISGNVSYCGSAIPIANAQLELTGDTELDTNTDASGNYQLDEVQGSVTLTALKSDEISDINGFDLLRLKNILLGIHTPSSCESWAAECNGTAPVNAFDLLRLKNYLLGLAVDPPIATWGFDPGNYSYSPIDADKVDQDFAGVIFGDINLSWGSSSSALAKSTGDGRIDFGGNYFDAAGNIHVPITSDRELMLGMLDWSIEFDSTLFTLESLNSRFLEQGDYHCSNGQVKIVWVYTGEEEIIHADESICELVLRPTRDRGTGKFWFGGSNYLSTGNEEPYDLTYGDTQINLTFLAISEDGALPTETTLYPNYPNPFNPRTTISYYLVQPSDATINIFNLRGESQRSYHYPNQAAGFYQLEWNGKDSQGMAVPSGIYFYQLQHEGFSQMKRMVLMK